MDAGGPPLIFRHFCSPMIDSFGRIPHRACTLALFEARFAGQSSRSGFLRFSRAAAVAWASGFVWRMTQLASARFRDDHLDPFFEAHEQCCCINSIWLDDEGVLL